MLSKFSVKVERHQSYFYNGRCKEIEMSSSHELSKLRSERDVKEFDKFLLERSILVPQDFSKIPKRDVHIQLIWMVNKIKLCLIIVCDSVIRIFCLLCI